MPGRRGRRVESRAVTQTAALGVVADRAELFLRFHADCPATSCDWTEGDCSASVAGDFYFRAALRFMWLREPTHG